MSASLGRLRRRTTSPTKACAMCNVVSRKLPLRREPSATRDRLRRFQAGQIAS